MTLLSYVGSTAAATGTGPQEFHSVGFQPTAIIFWWTPLASASWASTTDGIGYGFAANNGGTLTAGYVSASGQGGVNTSVEYSRWVAGSCIGLIQYNGTVLAEATIESFDSNGFTLEWNPAYSTGYMLNYLCLGGTEIPAAQIVSWTAQTSNGNQTPTSSLGFTPGCVITIGTENASASPSTATHAFLNLGAMDSSGNQWAEYTWAQNGVTTTQTGRIQLTDACIVGNGYSNLTTYLASYVSMNNGGFTVNWNPAPASAWHYLSLCLEGVDNYQVGSWGKTTNTQPIFDSVSTPNLTPTSVLITTDSYPYNEQTTNKRISLGACDKNYNANTVYVTDNDAAHPTVTYRYYSTSPSIVVSNSGTDTLDSQGLVAAFGPCVASPAGLPPNEGICTDGTYWYAIQEAAIYKYDSNWNLVAQNTNAGINAGAAHLGGGDYYGGNLYIAACNATSGSNPTITNAAIAVFNSSTLAYVTSVDISAQFNANTDPSGCGIDITDDILWVCSFWNGGTIYQYNLTDIVSGSASLVGSITPSPATSYLQDVKYYNGNLYVSYCNYPSLTGGVTKMSTSGTGQSVAVPDLTAYDVSMEIEGLCVTSSGISLLIYYSGLNEGIVYTFGFTGGFTPWWVTSNAVATQLCYVAFGSLTESTSWSETTVPGSVTLVPSVTVGTASDIAITTVPTSTSTSKAPTVSTANKWTETTVPTSTSTSSAPTISLSTSWRQGIVPGDLSASSAPGTNAGGSIVWSETTIPTSADASSAPTVSVTSTPSWTETTVPTSTSASSAPTVALISNPSVAELVSPTSADASSAPTVSLLTNPIWSETTVPTSTSASSAPTVSLGALVVNASWTQTTVPGDTSTASAPSVAFEKYTLGKTWWNGIDLTQPPYHAFLTSNTKYDWLAGITFLQVPTGQDTMESTAAYPGKMVIACEYKIGKDFFYPDVTRVNLQSAWNALDALTDPILEGEGTLILGEFPGSYWIAKRLQTTPTDEADYPAMADVTLQFAVNGPAYSVTESEALVTLITAARMNITSNGDMRAFPCWAFYSAGEFIGTITITNQTSNESLVWDNTTTGISLNFGDYLTFSMDDEYGTAFTVLLNGEANDDANAAVQSAFWPHLLPGDNTVVATASVAARPTAKSSAGGLVRVLWRDRFQRGQQTVPLPVVPTVVLPTGLTIDVQGNPVNQCSNSPEYDAYTVTGDLKDVFLRPLADAFVTLYTYTSPGSQSIEIGSVLTDATGNYAFPLTQEFYSTQYFYVKYAGQIGTYLSSQSGTIETVPPSMRTPTTLTLNTSGTLPLLTLYGDLNTSSAPVYGANISFQVLALSDIPYASSWQLVPGAGTVTTASDGYYAWYDFDVPWVGANHTNMYRAWFPGNTMYCGSLSTPFTVSDNDNYEPAQLPGPITYGIEGPASVVTSGVIEYFAAMGFTQFILACDGNAAINMNTYAEELAVIQNLGMTPVLDIEFAVLPANYAVSWSSMNDSANPTQYLTTQEQMESMGPWFAALKAVGWENVSTERAYQPMPLPSGAFEYGAEVSFATGYFTGYTNYTYNDAGSSSTWNYWATNIGVTQNNYEFYYGTTDDLGNITGDPGYFRNCSLEAFAMGNPNGLISYIGAYSAWPNNVNGAIPNVMSEFDYSYAYGFGYNSYILFIDPGYDVLSGMGAPPEYYLLQVYLANSADSVVANMQSVYPPANTGNIQNITQIAPVMTLNVLNVFPGVFTITGVLSELISGDPIPDAEVYLQYSNYVGTIGAPLSFANYSGVTNPATTDEYGNYTWSNVALTPGPYQFRMFYPGTGNYLNTYTPWNWEGMEVDSFGAGTTPTTMALTTSTSTPTTGATFLLTATLKDAYGNLIPDESVSITYWVGGYKYNATTPLITNASGQVSFLATCWFGSPYSGLYTATFFGDSTYATSNATVTITP
jgi:hypothetical protein